MDDFKRSHIPAFGNWDYEDGGLPITQYFESARQAGLLRYSYGEAGGGGGGDLYSYSSYGGFEENDLYLKPTIAVVPRRNKQQTKGSSEWEYQQQQQQKKQARVHDMTLTASRSLQQHVRQAPKAVDEDLYKIPPELLYTTTTTNSHNKKRRTFGFFSRCLMPLCTTV